MTASTSIGLGVVIVAVVVYAIKSFEDGQRGRDSALGPCLVVLALGLAILALGWLGETP